MKAAEGSVAELSEWTRKQGWSVAELEPKLDDAIRESGTLAEAIFSTASKVIPLNGTVHVNPAGIVQALAGFRSGEFAESLQNAPEPTPEELKQIIAIFQDALPNLRRHFHNSSKLGPRHRRGGRPKAIDNEGERERIREELRTLRRPGVRLQDLYPRLAIRYGVSPTAIKRIWLEKTESTPSR